MSPEHPVAVLAQRRADIVALYAAGRTLEQIAEQYEMSLSGLRQLLRRANVYVCKRRGSPRGASVPSDFAEHAGASSNPDLAERYGVTVATVGRWRRETGIKAPPVLASSSVAIPVPDGFALVAPTMTLRELRVRYGRCANTIRRWCAAADVEPRRVKRQAGAYGQVSTPRLVVGRATQKFSPLNTHNRDMSRVGQAVDFLRKFGPVVRCNIGGRYDPKGDRWRRGSSILTADEIVERARRNGWDPDAWKRVAA